MRIFYNSRNIKKSVRKAKIEAKYKHYKIKEVFSQLSPIDEMRIINKVNADMKRYEPEDCMCPNINALIKRISLAYEYAVRLTDTILV